MRLLLNHDSEIPASERLTVHACSGCPFSLFCPRTPVSRSLGAIAVPIARSQAARTSDYVVIAATQALTEGVSQVIAPRRPVGGGCPTCANTLFKLIGVSSI